MIHNKSKIFFLQQHLQPQQRQQQQQQQHQYSVGISRFLLSFSGFICRKNFSNMAPILQNLFSSPLLTQQSKLERLFQTRILIQTYYLSLTKKWSTLLG
jgi:hypothetical protein